jgi:hypothetical protein
MAATLWHSRLAVPKRIRSLGARKARMLGWMSTAIVDQKRFILLVAIVAP